MSNQDTVLTSFKLPKELWKEIKIAAIRQGITMRDIVTIALTEWAKNHPS